MEPVLEKVGETSRECNSIEMTLAPPARYTDLDEKGPDDQDSFAKLLAELDLEIEEEADIEFGDQLDLGMIQEGSSNCPTLVEGEAELLLRDEWDVRTDHPTSALGECCEEALPTEFSRDTQEVPGCVAEQVLKGLTLGIPLPAADRWGSANSEEEEILYTDTTTPVNESTLTVDNDEVQRFVDLQEVFSFHAFNGTAVQATPDGATEQGAIYQMMTDETFPIYNNDVPEALNHSGNEFTLTPEREIVSQLSIEREECFKLGRGDCSPTTEDQKEKSEDKAYFYPVRLPCKTGSGDVHWPIESRLSSSWPQEAVSPFNIKSTQRRPTSRIRTTLSPTVRPGGYQRSRMRTFNREFGYKTRKHPISCRQSDIRRWIPDDNGKDWRTSPPGSSNDYSRGENPESYTPDIELLSSTLSLTGAQEQLHDHFTLETSPGNNQEDVARHDFVNKSERLLQLAADNQRELPSDTCGSPIGRGDMLDRNQTVLPLARLHHHHHHGEDGSRP